MNISQTDLITITKNLSILEFKTTSKDDKKLIQEIFDIFNTSIEKETNNLRDFEIACGLNKLISPNASNKRHANFDQKETPIE